VLNSLKILLLNKLKSIAFPAISAGVYGFPAEKCAEIMISTIIEFIEDQNKNGVNLQENIEIYICLFGSEMYQIFEEAFREKIRG
jgi:O-acetyl-ADP-ribose deacetylase (regulator of RNase III)